MHFKVNLTLVSVLLIVLLFNIPFYKNWLNTNLLGPSFDIFTLSKQMDLEQRKVNRFGYSYAVYMDFVKKLKQAKVADPVILLPSDAYMKAGKVKDFLIVEPAIFYYFTGIKCVLYDSPNVEKANCSIVSDGNGKVLLRKIANKVELESIIADFKKYK